MRILSLSFFAGTLILLQFSVLPPLPLVTAGVGLMLVFSATCGYKGGYRCASGVVFFVLGLSWAYWQAGQLLQARITPELEGQTLWVEGKVEGIPTYAEDSVRFVFVVQHSRLVETGEAVPFSGKVRIGWYQHFPPGMQAGEHWRLLIRAKQPNGALNPGGFDYEKWLFSQRIVASAYVRKATANARLDEGTAHGFSGAVDRARQSILTAIQQEIGTLPQQSLVAALAVAWRNAISPDQWEVLRRTGTSHLVAISGLHIGLVAGAGFLLVAGFWWLCPLLYVYLPVRIAGAVAGALLATGYALLAGLTLPTQRALAMVLIIMCGLLLRRRIAFTQTLALALLVVLWLDPLAALSAGFWLSFLSVLMIFLLSQRSLRRRSRWLVISIQLGLSLGMIPLTASFFGSVALMSAPANLLAVPVVSLMVVPLVLLGVVLLPLNQWLAGECWQLAEWVLQLLFAVLTYLAEPAGAALQLAQLPLFGVLLALCGFLLLMMPSGLPGRWLGLLLLLPVFYWQPARPVEGAFRLTMLDVGQGLAVAVTTRQHVLIYDAGPRFNERFDAGRMVVLPWLYAQGYQRLDTLMVSHADNDHSGGAAALLEVMPVQRLLSGAETLFVDHAAERCLAGQQWEWNGVSFHVLHPSLAYADPKRNNGSCVLRVDNGQHSVLLSGDIERPAEYLLSQRLRTTLQADVLLVPHHGSKSSSSPAFLKQVAPELALVSAGYRNRFHHPHPSVRQRYSDWGIELLSTVDSGAIQIDFPPDESARVVQHYRQQQRGLWNRR